MMDTLVKSIVHPGERGNLSCLMFREKNKKVDGEVGGFFHIWKVRPS